MRVIAIIVAAGSGSRFGKPKQFELLGGEPVFIHSVRAFLLCKRVDRLVLVTSEELMEEMNSLLHAKGIAKAVSVTLGGERRQDSVMNGLVSAHADDDDVVLVHDAARPLVSQKIIHDVIDATITHGAALAAVQVVDTLKREEDGFATDTVDRGHLWRAQTPQSARAGLLRDALKNAQNKGVTGTDEAQLLSLISVESFIVSSDERNFKITYPDDLARAEALL